MRHALSLSSIWKEYPLDWILSSPTDSRTGRRKALKPPVASLTGNRVMTLAYHDPNKLIKRRRIGQFTTAMRPPT